MAAATVAPASAVAQTAPQDIRLRKAGRKLLGPDAPASDIFEIAGADGTPIIRARQNAELQLRIVNELDGEVWLHFHGVRGPAETMTVQVPPGEANALTITLRPPDAGTFLILPLLNASRLRDMGLHALLIVEEAMPLPNFADVPLIFDDWKIGDDGKLDQSFGDLEAAIGEGRMGNWFTVNGTFKPRIAVDRSKNIRLRLANVANTRTFTFQFKNCDLNYLAFDGQPVPMRPVGLDPVMLAPGQRMDLLLFHPLDQVVIALDLFEDVVEAAFLDVKGTQTDDLPDNFTLPRNPLAEPADVAAAREIAITLAGGAKGGLKSAKVGDQVLDLRALLERGLAWAVNGFAGPGGEDLFTAKTGETLILSIDNQTNFSQPLHIHGHVWREIERDGEAIEDGPWRDTGIVKGLSKSRFIMVAVNPGQWAIQSLVAERSDAGLIGGFAVADMP